MSGRETLRVDQLRAEARYHRQRLDLYRARLYGGRALSVPRLEEFQRAADDAAARLRQAVEDASTARPQAERDRTRASHRSASTSGAPNN
jgi:hypothetical protein